MKLLLTLFIAACGFVPAALGLEANERQLSGLTFRFIALDEARTVISITMYNNNDTRVPPKEVSGLSFHFMQRGRDLPIGEAQTSLRDEGILLRIPPEHAGRYTLRIRRQMGKDLRSARIFIPEIPVATPHN